MMDQNLITPNLFCIGGMRCGSTTLHLLLNQHPEICMSSVKEPMFYSAEALRRQVSRSNQKDPKLENLLSQFVSAGKHREKMTYLQLFSHKVQYKYYGESSHYLYDKEVTNGTNSNANIIYEDCPNAKIIVIIRNPVERLFSEYMYYRRENIEIIKMLSFEDFSKTRIDKGFYSKLIRPWINKFSPAQVKVILFDDLTQQPINVCRSIFKWLDINEDFIVNSIHTQKSGIPKYKKIFEIVRSPGPVKKIMKIVLPKMVREQLRSKFYSNILTKPKIDTKTFDSLKGVYREDIEELEKILRINLQQWK